MSDNAAVRVANNKIQAKRGQIADAEEALKNAVTPEDQSSCQNALDALNDEMKSLEEDLLEAQMGDE